MFFNSAAAQHASSIHPAPTTKHQPEREHLTASQNRQSSGQLLSPASYAHVRKLQTPPQLTENVAGFAEQYRANELFSGIVKDGELVGSNHPTTIVEDDGDCGFASSNCWTKLGISGRGVTDPVFVEIMRGAVFGLICCVHKQPSRLNVDMIYGNGMDFVHVDGEQYNEGPDCCFSVFSFLTYGWARELVLVG